MEEQYEKIEGYLGGTLSADERAAFETALSADAELRAEVALHRQLADSFADPGELALRETLEELAGEEAPRVRTVPQEAAVRQLPARRGWLWPVLGLAAIALGAYFFLPAILGGGNTLPSANPELEAIIERGSDPVYDFELSASQQASGGEAQLRIEGELLAVNLPADSSFVVQVYSSDPEDFPAKPLYSTVVRPVEDKSQPPMSFGGKKAFSVALEAKAPNQSSTYYFVVRDKAGEEVIYAGKVTAPE